MLPVRCRRQYTTRERSLRLLNNLFGLPLARRSAADNSNLALASSAASHVGLDLATRYKLAEVRSLADESAVRVCNVSQHPTRAGRYHDTIHANCVISPRALCPRGVRICIAVLARGDGVWYRRWVLLCCSSFS